MIQTGKLLLAIGGTLSAVLAVAHLIVLAIGPAGYRFFGAGDTLGRLAESGSGTPAKVMLVATGVMVLCAVYGFSGAGLIRRLPLLRPALAVIAFVYLLRGLSAFPQGVAFVMRPSTMPFQYFVVSFVSLVAGVCYAMGARVLWAWLGGNEET